MTLGLSLYSGEIYHAAIIGIIRNEGKVLQEQAHQRQKLENSKEYCPVLFHHALAPTGA